MVCLEREYCVRLDTDDVRIVVETDVYGNLNHFSNTRNEIDELYNKFYRRMFHI